MRERIFGAIERLPETPRPVGSLKLKDSEFRHVRVGDYRIIYDVNDDGGKITIVKVAHRRDIYR